MVQNPNVIKRARTQEPPDFRDRHAFFFHHKDGLYLRWGRFPVVRPALMPDYQDLGLPKSQLLPRKGESSTLEPLQNFLAILDVVCYKPLAPVRSYRFILLFQWTSLDWDVIQKLHGDVKDAIPQNLVHCVHHVRDRVGPSLRKSTHPY